MCQAFESESRLVASMEKWAREKEYRKQGKEDYYLGIKRELHPYNRDRGPGLGGEWYEKDWYYGSFVRAWQEGWDAGYRESGQHDRDVAAVLGIAPL